MTFVDTLTSVGVLLGVFFLAYASIRHKDLTEIMVEIRDMIKGKVEDAKDKLVYA